MDREIPQTGGGALRDTSQQTGLRYRGYMHTRSGCTQTNEILAPPQGQCIPECQYKLSPISETISAMPTTLLLGGARSGKSRRAQRLAEEASSRRVFIATAEPLDEEMAIRIAHHQADRAEGWRTLETPLDLVSALGRADENESIVVDCLTLWLSNLMHYDRNVDVEIEKLCATLAATSRTVFLVSNEIGLGLVPDTKLGRSFRDAQGRLNQGVASACGVVEFVAAGLPLRLKP